MKSFSYNTQLSYDVSPEDKEVAKKAELYFNHLLSVLDKSIKHFNILYDPMNENSDVPQEQTIKNRASLREYRDQIIQNFNEVKKISLDCFKIMNHFSSDTETFEILNSFIDQLDILEDQVNKLIKVFDNLSSDDFKANITNNMDIVKKEVGQLEQIVNDRIVNHIHTNILGKDWVEEAGKQFGEKIEEKVPYLIQLYKDRENAIKNVTKLK